MKLLLTILLFMVFASASQAQWKVTVDEDNEICNSSGNQTKPLAVTDGSGGFMVTWADSRKESNFAGDIYMQHIDRYGYITLTPNGLPLCIDTLQQSDPRMVRTSDGGYIIAWIDSRVNNTDGTDIYAQKIDINGNPQWAVNGIQISDPITKVNGAIAEFNIMPDKRGGAFVTWTRSYYGYLQLRIQRIDKNGALLWDSTGVKLTDGAVDTRAPRMIADPANQGVVIVYRHSGPGTYPIYAQRIDTSGKTLWPLQGLPVATQGSQRGGFPVPSNLYNGSIAAVAWINESSKIYIQLIDTAGTKLWGDDGLAVNSHSGLHQRVKIASDGNNGTDLNFYLIWSDGRRAGINSDVYGQRINVKGEVSWSTNGILISNDNTYMVEPDIAVSGSLVYAAWVATGAEGNGIYVQKINPDSSFSWKPNGIKISSKNSPPSIYLTGTAQDDEGAVVLFEATGAPANSGQNIYMKRVKHDGTLGSPSGVDQFKTNSNSELYQNSPNPFFNSTEISFNLSSPGEVTLKIFDLFGREVHQLLNQYMKQGYYSVNFNSAGLPSGNYYYQLRTDKYVITKSMINNK